MDAAVTLRLGIVGYLTKSFERNAIARALKMAMTWHLDLPTATSPLSHLTPHTSHLEALERQKDYRLPIEVFRWCSTRHLLGATGDVSTRWQRCHPDIKRRTASSSVRDGCAEAEMGPISISVRTGSSVRRIIG
jgi:hypothetical protein